MIRTGRKSVMEDVQINVTPMIDLMIFLIVFFLTATTFTQMEREQEVMLPSTHGSGSLSRALDRAWALSLLQEAARVQAELAAKNCDRAVRRVELLRLRFQDGLPIRDIAARWNEDAAKLHHEYAVARDEFRAALCRVLAFHMPSASETQLDAACRDLLGLLK